MSNIRKVALAAGVSVATVSRALTNPEKVSDESLKKVHDAIKAVGYRPNLLARNFRAAKSFSVVVLVPDITNPFFSQVIQAIEDRAQQKGYAVLLGDTRETSKREQEYVNRVETRLADGVIQLRPQSMSSSTQKIPWVNACGCEGTPGPSIRIDNIAAIKSIVGYLISLGHQRIGLISGLKDNPHSVDRLQGFKAGLAAAGIAFEQELVAEGDFTLWSGQNAAKQFLRLKQMPTAICCMNDEMALGAIQSLKAAGLRVPEDVSVTGFDDINYAKYWDPGLTTMAQPAEEIGKLAMDTLLRIIDGEDLASAEVVLPTDIVIRNSTCPPQR
jgi:LacI family repressor for deo operon, udp, cdd, tsx, nupC, and nupG